MYPQHKSVLLLTCAFFTAPALLGLPEPLLWLDAALLEWLPLLRCMGLRLMKRVASSRKESRGPEQNWSSSDKLAAGARSRGRGLRMVEDAMTAAGVLLLVTDRQLNTPGGGNGASEEAGQGQ